jgi:hypothetical protein
MARRFGAEQCFELVRCNRCGKGTPNDEPRCPICGGYISINLKPNLGRKCACVAVGESEPMLAPLDNWLGYCLDNPGKPDNVHSNER